MHLTVNAACMSIRSHIKKLTEHTATASFRNSNTSDPANIKIDRPLTTAGTVNLHLYYGKYRQNMISVSLEATYQTMNKENAKQIFSGYICRNTEGQDNIYLECTGPSFNPHKITGSIENYIITQNHTLNVKGIENIYKNKTDPTTFNLTFEDSERRNIKIHGLKLDSADPNNYETDSE